VLYPQIDRSAPTVKADAAWRSYNARPRIVWAVIDSGVDGCHPHFSALELAAEAGAVPGRRRCAPPGCTGFHRAVRLPGDRRRIPGTAHRRRRARHPRGRHHRRETPPGHLPHVAASDEPPSGGGFVQRPRVGSWPECHRMQLVSLGVLHKTAQGVWITSSAAVIAALDYLRTEVNVDTSVLRVHGVNISLGCPWIPVTTRYRRRFRRRSTSWWTRGRGCRVRGQRGRRQAQDPAGAMLCLGSIRARARRELHRSRFHAPRAPHAFGVSWTSGKGPTLDGTEAGRGAPGEWIASAAVGMIRARAA
jgi:hypothetical protein